MQELTTQHGGKTSLKHTSWVYAKQLLHYT